MTKTNTSIPPRIVTVARDGSSMAHVPGVGDFPIWVITVYEGRRRQRDGRGTWRRAYTVGQSRSGRCPSERLLAAAREYAAREGLPFEEGIRHGAFCLAAMPDEVQVAYILGDRRVA